MIPCSTTKQAHGSNECNADVNRNKLQSREKAVLDFLEYVTDDATQGFRNLTRQRGYSGTLRPLDGLSFRLSSFQKRVEENDLWTQMREPDAISNIALAQEKCGKVARRSGWRIVVFALALQLLNLNA
jgi:hypothetical protein